MLPDMPNKDSIAKDVIKSKTGRFKNIFSKDLCIKEIKPRLRDDSPDSPKRILDCVKRYNWLFFYYSISLLLLIFRFVIK